MYPFFVLGVGHDATDEQVQARYRQLVKRFDPERWPEQFAEVRRAYEQLQSERARLLTRLFYFDETGRSLSEEVPRWLASQPRRRMRPEELAGLIDDGVESE